MNPFVLFIFKFSLYTLTVFIGDSSAMKVSIIASGKYSYSRGKEDRAPDALASGKMDVAFPDYPRYTVIRYFNQKDNYSHLFFLLYCMDSCPQVLLLGI